MAVLPKLAHISKEGRTQTISEHLQGTAVLAESFASVFGAGEQGKLAGTAHDIGKYADKFQQRLQGSKIKVDHSTAGALECMKICQPYAAFAVAGHHGGLPDGGGKTDSSDEPTFFGKMKRKPAEYLESYDDWKNEVTLPKAGYPDFLHKGLAEQMFFIRMLYSCLVDADYLDTEAFMLHQKRESNQSTMEELWNKLYQAVSPWFSPENDLNCQRSRILRQAMEAGNIQNKGLFSLTVPTGGGKTVASLAFALAHAKKMGMRRVIYVIPYTSIIEQTAKTFRKILGAENVLEHHSNLLFDTTDESDPDTVKFSQATENWDMPVIVTTAVQFFESLFACRSSKCRKLHNIAGSVIIFDEAQMLPLPYLHPCVFAISQLVQYYNVSAVLCTATQPALEPVFRLFFPNVSIEEICPPEIYDASVFQRVSFVQKGSMTWDALAEELNQTTQSLCIVNTRKAAREIFSRLEGEGNFHLSTYMYPLHRKKKLEEIRRRLQEGKPCRVISTSLIEAGVDVDFPVVYREMAGLDSILQAAGRCNREGKRSAEASKVYIFKGEGKVPSLIATAVETSENIIRLYPDFSSYQAIHAYFAQLFILKGPSALDKSNIISMMHSSSLPFRTIEREFHLINDDSQTIYIPVYKGAEIVDQIRLGQMNRHMFRQLGQYAVTVYQEEYNAFLRAGYLEQLANGMSVLKDTSLYTDKTGLCLQLKEGEGLFI